MKDPRSGGNQSMEAPSISKYSVPPPLKGTAPHSSGTSLTQGCLSLTAAHCDAQMLCETDTMLSHKANIMKGNKILGFFLMRTPLMLVLKYHIDSALFVWYTNS